MGWTGIQTENGQKLQRNRQERSPKEKNSNSQRNTLGPRGQGFGDWVNILGFSWKIWGGGAKKALGGLWATLSETRGLAGVTLDGGTCGKGWMGGSRQGVDPPDIAFKISLNPSGFGKQPNVWASFGGGRVCPPKGRRPNPPHFDTLKANPKTFQLIRLTI